MEKQNNEGKTGKWTMYYSSLICSECGSWTLGNNGSIKPYAYCPHCGARMLTDKEAKA